MFRGGRHAEIDRVVDREMRRERHPQLFPGPGRELLHEQAGADRGVGHEDAGSAGIADDRDPGARGEWL